MLQLFDSKSSLMAALGALLDWFLLSLLTWICSVPVITAGPAWTALYGVMDAAEVVIDPDHNLIEAFYIAHQGIDIEGKQQRPADKHHTGDKHADGSHRHLPVGADIVQALLDQIAKGILKHGKHLLDPG